jgi:hypothetical protein
MRTALAFLALFSIASIAALADPPMTKLHISVRAPSDKPVDRAAVIVQFVEGRSTVKLGKKIITHWELRTNQDGEVSPPRIPQGKIRVQVIAAGYQTFGEVYDVQEPEKTIEVKLNPPQPQYSSHDKP